MITVYSIHKKDAASKKQEFFCEKNIIELKIQDWWLIFDEPVN